jgi:hypothetical protein
MYIYIHIKILNYIELKLGVYLINLFFFYDFINESDSIDFSTLYLFHNTSINNPLE